MPRPPDPPPDKAVRAMAAEALLRRVIQDLEHDDAPQRQLRGLHALLTEGPFRCSLVGDPDPWLVAAELLKFLRDSVRTRGLDPRRSTQGSIGTRTFFNFTNHVRADGQVRSSASGPDARDLAVLQLVILLREVGLRNVFFCSAGDCPHLVVKTYRRTYCSQRCQQRHYKRQQRAEEKRDEQIRARRQRRRRITKGQS